jgi:hypothetical protein
LKVVVEGVPTTKAVAVVGLAESREELISSRISLILSRSSSHDSFDSDSTLLSNLLLIRLISLCIPVNGVFSPFCVNNPKSAGFESGTVGEFVPPKLTPPPPPGFPLLPPEPPSSPGS